MALIYIVEDDKNILEIESFALKNSGYDIRGFATAKEFYKALNDFLPDLILLDIMLPDEDGLSILKKLRSDVKTKSLPIILVTAKTTEIDKVKGLDSGADDYMTKPFGVMELISRVKALLRRALAGASDASVYEFMEIVMDVDKRLITVSGETCDLTYKEYELLKLFMANPGIVIKRERILEKIWGTDFEGESRTIDMHIKNLRQKLKTAGKYIKTIRNVGYVLNGE
ncbi:MAG: response regulator transcription factor [Lachnospiraceae bacterium]|nr:response regulator transcription factor [Lachnospiraceae bacterium]MBO5325535.1 response regulator transcription factor [Lachnospiraceae bacterium]